MPELFERPDVYAEAFKTEKEAKDFIVNKYIEKHKLMEKIEAETDDEDEKERLQKDIEILKSIVYNEKYKPGHKQYARFFGYSCRPNKTEYSILKYVL